MISPWSNPWNAAHRVFYRQRLLTPSDHLPVIPVAADRPPSASFPEPLRLPGVGAFSLSFPLLMSLYMAHHLPRVIRAYSLPVPLFDHLKVFQRSLQLAADLEAGAPAREGDAHWIDNSRALANLVQQHVLFSVAAGQAGSSSADFASALYQGDLIAVSPTEVER
jgi:hypothetical protein